MIMGLTPEMRTSMRVPYALRRVPAASLAGLAPCPDDPQPGDVALARLEKIGKNAGLELINGRRCTLHEGDLLAVAFGHRYATQQFEGYARADGDRCDLMSMGGLCGLVESKHATVAEPSKLRLLGAVADATGRPLRLRDFALAPVPAAGQPRVIVVCGTSMDAGKTYTVMSVILGLRRQGCRVAGIKLTGTAAGRDTWNMLDAGACVALDFVDGGWPSTYQCTPDELQAMYRLLLSHVTAQGAEYVVVEIADGLLQKETAGLLQTSRFTSTVDAFVLAAGEPMAVAHGVQVLQTWGITPVAFSGVVSMSFLNIREAELATRIPCLTARDLQAGAWTLQMLRTAPEPAAAVG